MMPRLASNCHVGVVTECSLIRRSRSLGGAYSLHRLCFFVQVRDRVNLHHIYRFNPNISAATLATHVICPVDVPTVSNVHSENVTLQSQQPNIVMCICPCCEMCARVHTPV